MKLYDKVKRIFSKKVTVTRRNKIVGDNFYYFKIIDIITLFKCIGAVSEGQ